MKAKVTLELEINIPDEDLIHYSDDPSPPGVALPPGRKHYVELPEEGPVPGNQIYEDLCRLLYEHEEYPDHTGCKDPEAFLEDLYNNYGLLIELKP